MSTLSAVEYAVQYYQVKNATQLAIENVYHLPAQLEDIYPWPA